MAFKVRVSKPITKVQARLDGLISIDPKLDLGETVSVVEGTKRTVAANKALSDYNQALNKADDLLNVLRQQEKELAAWGTKALNGVKFKFGPDSSEYEMAGGVRLSERKKGGPKSKSPAKPV